MTEAIEVSTSAKSLPKKPIGFILDPFQWAAEHVALLLESDPSLYPDLIHLTRPRLHLMAFAFAHVGNDASPEWGKFLFRRSAKDVVDRILGRRPRGLTRVFQHLPSYTLAAESYRKLIPLLDEERAAKLLRHMKHIDGNAINIIEETPVQLRSVLHTTRKYLSQGSNRDRKGLINGLRYLAHRSSKKTLDEFADELSKFRQSPQVVAYIHDLVEALPLPNSLPPESVHHARRVDSPTEIRRLSREWNICLTRQYLRDINEGRFALYLWEHEDARAACMTQRSGRLGWCLEEVKGPDNQDIPRPLEIVIREAFEAEGIPDYWSLRAINQIIKYRQELAAFDADDFQ